MNSLCTYSFSTVAEIGKLEIEPTEDAVVRMSIYFGDGTDLGVTLLLLSEDAQNASRMLRDAVRFLDGKLSHWPDDCTVTTRNARRNTRH